MEPIGTHRRARGHQPRRRDGQAHRLRRRPRAAAGAQGARSRRPGRRAAERLADAATPTATSRWTPRSRSPTSTAAARRGSSRTPTTSTGGWTTGCTPPTRDTYLRFKNGKFEVRKTLIARRVGRHPGRRRADLPEHQRVVGARRLRADAVFPAQPGPACAPAAATRRCATRPTRQRRLAGAAQLPAPTARISSASIAPTARSTGSPRCARRTSIAAIGCPRSSTATCSSPSRPPTWSAGSSIEDDGTTLRARKAYERGEFLASTDERFRPVWLSNAPDGTLLHRRHVPRRHPAARRHHRIPARSHRPHKLEQPNGSAASIASCTRRRGATRSGCSRRLTGAQLVETTVASERLVARHGAALLVERGDDRGRSRAGEAGRGREGLEDAAARAVDARRHRRDRAGRWWRRRSTTRRATCARPRSASRSDGWTSRTSPFSRGAEAAGRRGLAGTAPAGGVARRAAARRRARRRSRRCSNAYADDPITMDAALSGVRGSEAAVLEQLLQVRRSRTPPTPDAAARGRDHDARRDADSRRAGSDGAEACSTSIADESRPPGSGRRCCAAPRWRCWARRCRARPAARRGGPAPAAGRALPDLSRRTRRSRRRLRVSAGAAPPARAGGPSG